MSAQTFDDEAFDHARSIWRLEREAKWAALNAFDELREADADEEWAYEQLRYAIVNLVHSAQIDDGQFKRTGVLLSESLDCQPDGARLQPDPVLEEVLVAAGCPTAAWGKGLTIRRAFPTLKALASATREELLRLRQVGPKTVDAIELALLVRGQVLTEVAS